MLNDTVATLLAGMAHGHEFDARGTVGFVLGTGTNTAYIEQNRNISKFDGYAINMNGEQVINVESGGFDRFSRGPMDPQLQSKEESEGFNAFEKVLAGEYMGPLTLEI
jgi:hexokinase